MWKDAFKLKLHECIEKQRYVLKSPQTGNEKEIKGAKQEKAAKQQATFNQYTIVKCRSLQHYIID